MRLITTVAHTVLYALIPGLFGFGYCGPCCQVRECLEESDDPWYVAPPPGVTNALPAVPPGRVHLVDVDMIAQAETLFALLPSESAIPQDMAAASMLVGRELAPIEGANPYLVHALANADDSSENWHFDVRFGSVILYIGYPTLGLCDFEVPTQRAPLVVFLPSEPQVVYVEIEAAPI